jgi:cytochrome c556
MRTTKLPAMFVGVVIAAGGVMGAQGQSPAASQGQNSSAAEVVSAAAEVVKTRQKGLKTLGAAFKTIRDELKTDSPDAAKIRAASADITAAAGLIGKWFPTGSGPDSGVKTDAKAEIWTDAGGFAAARDGFVREANKWTQLGTSGDAAAWKEGVAALGQSCKGCHDKYRVKKE